MKIIKKGEGAKADWWHGSKLTCQTCAQEVELEAGDKFTVHGPWLIVATCENCADHMPLRRLV